MTIEDVQRLVDHAQRLADARPRVGYSVAWYVEADQFGDVGTIGAVAITAVRDSALSLREPFKGP